MSGQYLHLVLSTLGGTSPAEEQSGEQDEGEILLLDAAMLLLSRLVDMAGMDKILHGSFACNYLGIASLFLVQ